LKKAFLKGNGEVLKRRGPKESNPKKDQGIHWNPQVFEKPE